MPKTRYYVVWKGKMPGIYATWKECEEQVKGVEGAVYKAFPTRESAEKALADDYRNHIGKEPFQVVLNLTTSFQGPLPDLDSLSVDAACKGNPGILEYRGVWTRTGEEVFRGGPFPEGTVNLGEFLGIVHGLALLKQLGLSCPVYSDSRTAIKWLKDRAIKTKLERTGTTRILFEHVDRALKWLNENRYSNPVLKWDTRVWGEIPADFGRK
ncbi:MAG: ribonuclease H family protein [Bacteroidales bacterium]|nr:ribonuclease H family protein [Bacteroidales bacterium]